MHFNFQGLKEYAITNLSNNFTLLDMGQVVLVDQSERFVFKPMLYELLTGGMILRFFQAG